MTLLQKIQNEAINAKEPIGNLLRQCALLAARLNNEPLRDWVNKELNGYTTDDTLPAYRMLPAPATGTLLGAWGAQLNNVAIPASILPDNLKSYAQYARIRQPIAAVQALADSDERTNTLTSPWPGDLVAMVGNKFDNGYVLHSAWQTLSTASMRGVVDVVRNRILDFSLELEKTAPLAGEPDHGGDISPAQVTHLTQTIIHGNMTGGNIATASPGAIQTLSTITVGDVISLTAALESAGIPVTEAREVAALVVEEQSLGPKTTDWLRKAGNAIGSGAWKVGTGVTVAVIVKALLAFLGVP